METILPTKAVPEISNDDIYSIHLDGCVHDCMLKVMYSIWHPVYIFFSHWTKTAAFYNQKNIPSMKKQLIFILLLVMAFSGLKAKNADSFQYKRTLLYFELFGPGIVAPLNYERLFNLSRHLKLIPSIGYSHYAGNLSTPDPNYNYDFDSRAVVMKAGMFYVIKNFVIGGGVAAEPANITDAIGLYSRYGEYIYTLANYTYLSVFPYLALKYYHTSGIYLALELAINSITYGNGYDYPFPYEMSHYSNVGFYRNIDSNKDWTFTPGFDIGDAFNFKRKK